MARTLSSTPKQDGFRMPGEFEPHKQSWLIWPERTDTWRDGAKPAQKVFVDVATKLVKYEPLTVLCSAAQYENCRARLPEEIRVIEMSTDDAWTQDKGPSFVINDKGEVRGVHWGWNAYGGLEGGLYFPWRLDQQVGQKILEIEGCDRYDLSKKFVLENGATQVDGEGTLIVTEQVFMNHNRNGDMTKEETEYYLKEYMNIDKIIWLPLGMAFDETDGHVDDVCFFSRPGQVVLSWVDDPNHPQYDCLKKAYDILSTETDAKGRKLEVIKMHIPEVLYITEEENEGIDLCDDAAPRDPGMPLAVTYINSYLINGAVLVPQFGDPRDEDALKQMQEIYPDRDIVPIYTREWSLAGGNVHCMTLQQPAAQIK